ncbi:hypothetical protein MRX96_041943, partial [Rhipicephalus microplus]
TLTRHSLEVGKVAGIDLSSKQWLTPRVPKDILFVFGGWTSGATNNMHTFNSRAQKWRVMGSQYTTPRAYHGAAVIDSCIYFVGGFNGRECYHSVVCFNVPIARWSAKANMVFARCYGNIYAMGGFDGRARTRTVERYDIKANQWSQVADMTEVRSDASAVAVHGRIYIAGGFTGTTVLDSVESYDPSTNVWTRIATMSSPRSGAKVVAHKDMLYIIGGLQWSHATLQQYVSFRCDCVTLAAVDGHHSTIVEQLDVRRSHTSELPSMPHAKSNFAAVVLDGCIYVIGGFNGVTTVKLVERYDIGSRRWFTAPQLSTDCSASAACVVEDVADPGTPGRAFLLNGLSWTQSVRYSTELEQEALNERLRAFERIHEERAQDLKEVICAENRQIQMLFQERPGLEEQLHTRFFLESEELLGQCRQECAQRGQAIM